MLNKTTLVGYILLGFILVGSLLAAVGSPLTELTFGDSGIGTLDQWKATSTPYDAITSRSHAKNLYLPFSTATTSRIYATTFCINNASPDCITAWSSGGGSGTVSTSTNEIAGRLAYFTSNSGTPALLGQVATSAPAVASPLTYSGTLGSFVGGLAGTFDVSTTTDSLFSGTAGQVLAYLNGGWFGTATTTFSSGLTYLNGNVTADLGTAIDISDETNLTAGDALTLTGDDIDFDGGTTPAGDLGGTWASPSVTDDSHAHTGTSLSAISALDFSDSDWGDITITTNAAAVEDDSHAHTATTISGLGTADISGLDVSDDLNLTGGLGLTLTGDDMACDTASGSVFGCLSSTDWTTFNNSLDTYDAWTHPAAGVSATTSLIRLYGQASSTIFSAHYLSVGKSATTTIDNSGNVVIPSGSTLTNTGVSDGCGTFASGVLGSTGAACGSGGGVFPFSADTNFGQQVYSTSTPTLWLKSGLFASSTSQFSNATTTFLTVSNTAWVGSPVAGDSAVQFGWNPLDSAWSIGRDDTDGSFSIASSTVLGTTPALTIAKTTLASTFAGALAAPTLDTGQGANELYDMDQNVLVASSPTFAALTLTADLTVANGGTGASTLTGLLQGNGASAFTALADSSTVGQILRVTGASTYAWGALNLDDADAFTGTLPVANTQLTAGDHITLTTDDLDIDDDFILNTGDIGTGSYTFPNASTTNFSTSYASSTLYFGAGLADCNTENMLTWTAGRFGCESDTTGAGGGAWPFTPATHWGQEVQSTTTALFLQGTPFSLFASSTAQFSQASTTLLSVGTTAWVGNGPSTDGSILFGPANFQWVIGFDDTDDAFAISSSTLLGTSDALRINKSTLATTLSSLILTTDLTVANGGTGASTLTGLLQGNGASAFTAIADSSTVGQILRVTGASTYAWGALNLADSDAITGDLPFANLAQGAANTVLANITGATADFAAVATSSLFAETNGQLPARSGGTWTGIATTTFSGGLAFAAGNVTIDQAASFAWTGAHDFGGATSLEIPNGTSGTTDAIGEIYYDTTSGNLQIATSTTGSIAIPIATTTLYAFTATTSPIVSGTTMNLPSHPLAQAATKIWCKVSGGTSLVINLSDGTNDTNTATCTTTGAEYVLSSNFTFTAYEAIRVEYGTKTGDTGDIAVRIMGYRTTD